MRLHIKSTKWRSKTYGRFVSFEIGSFLWKFGIWASYGHHMGNIELGNSSCMLELIELMSEIENT